MTDLPVLSVVVAIVSDTIRRDADASHLEGCLAALSAQRKPPRMEILVPYHQAIRGIEKVRQRFPKVKFILASDLQSYRHNGHGREHHDELRSRGLAAARGEIVALIEDVGRPNSRWCANIVEAHQQDFAGVGGAIDNAIDRPLNWAVYFCDFGQYQNPLPPGPTRMISDANSSYKKEALDQVRSTWDASFNQVEVNNAIQALGGRLAKSPDIVAYQHRDGLRLREALAERFVWGRSFASSRCRWMRASARILRVFLAPVLPAVLLARMAAATVSKGRTVGALLKAIPYLVLLTLSWCAGELAGYVNPET